MAPPWLQAGHSGGVLCRGRTGKGPPGPYAPMNRTARSRSCSSGIPSSQLPPFRLSVAVRTICHLAQRQTAHPIRRPPSSHTNPKMGLGPWIAHRRNTGAHLLRNLAPAPPAASFPRLWPPASEGNTDRTRTNKTKEKERTDENPTRIPAVPRGRSHAEGGTDYLPYPGGERGPGHWGRNRHYPPDHGQAGPTLLVSVTGLVLPDMVEPDA